MKKVFFVLVRDYLSKGDRYLRIFEGPLKGLLWNVRSHDSRYFLGAYEKEMAAAINEVMPDANGFLDIGANVGHFAVLVTLKWPKVRVLAIEPFPKSVEILKSNLKKNGIGSIEIHEYAMSDVDGFAKMSNSINLAANTIIEGSYKQWEVDTMEVPTITLDSFAEKMELGDKWLIKIDVEGAELDLLKGGEKFLREKKPVLLLATHDCHIPGIEQDCLNFLAKLGYSYKEIPDDKIAGQKDFICRPAK